MALIRVKRRLDAEPAEILIVACKRIRRFTDSGDESDVPEDISATFTFAGTRDSKNSLESLDVAKVLTDARRNNPKSRVVNILDRSRKEFQEATKTNRLKLVNTYRVEQQSDIICLFDAEDDEEEARPDNWVESCHLDCSESPICCNDVGLNRENPSSEQLYVYDLYYTSDFNHDDVIVDHTFLTEQYVSGYWTDSSVDSEDSNDEKYHTNDFPEEDSEFETDRPVRKDHEDEESDYERNSPPWWEYEDGICNMLKNTHLNESDSSDEELKVSETDIHLHGKGFARFKAKALKELAKT